jgi:hypothetical protein
MWGSMESKPLVSVVINNYNYCRFLEQAIQSALDQTYPGVEVLVVDDGSTDDSPVIVHAFGDRIRSIFKTNGGQASTYNLGFRESRGALVLFLDADDFLLPTAIEKVVALWDSDTIAKIHFPLAVVDASGVHTGAVLPTGSLSSGNLKPCILADGNYTTPSGSGNVYSRSVLAKLLPMPEKEWVVGADTWPIYLAPLLGEVRACNEPLGVYRVHGANLDSHTTVNGPFLRSQMNNQKRRDDLLAGWCSAHGLSYASGTVQRHFIFQKLRLASLIIDPARHPYPEDSRTEVAWAAIQACLRYRDCHAAKKALIIGWILLLLVLPKSLAERAVEAAFVPAERSRLTNRLVQPPLRADPKQP